MLFRLLGGVELMGDAGGTRRGGRGSRGRGGEEVVDEYFCNLLSIPSLSSVLLQVRVKVQSRDREAYAKESALGAS